jgi:hypothetical protein
LKIYHILLALIITVLSNCGQKRADSKKLRIEIPDTSESELDILPYLYKNRLIDELNLTRLEHGVDSFELRFDTRRTALKCGFGQLLVFKRTDKEWTCFEYQYIIQNVPFGSVQNYATEFTIDTILVYKHEPVSGWMNFFAALEKENIYTLPDQEDISSWDSLRVAIADGTSYSVEFANQERYKFYTYNTPQDFVRYFKECMSMSNIIQILDKEIGVKDNVEEIIEACDKIHNTHTKIDWR